jgi:methionyl-tRNA synthetase
VDALRYFLIRNMNPARDAEFSAAIVDQRYQADLANNLGNLLNRIVAMIGRYCDGRIPSPGQPTVVEQALIQTAERLPAAVFAHVESFTLHEALEKILAFSSDINTYLEQTGPWHEARKGNEERVAAILYHAAESLRLVSVLLHPVMPEKTAELWHQLGWQPPQQLNTTLTWGCLQPSSQTNPGEPLFPRIE